MKPTPENTAPLLRGVFLLVLYDEDFNTPVHPGQTLVLLPDDKLRFAEGGRDDAVRIDAITEHIVPCNLDPVF